MIPPPDENDQGRAPAAPPAAAAADPGSYGTNDRSHRAAIWRLLADGLWHSQGDLRAVGGDRAPARIHELRHLEQLVIECRRVKQGVYVYRLAGVLTNPTPRPKSWKQRALIAEARVIELEAAGGVR